MENFVVSARKYRPTTFDSVVGQKSITTTLKNAILNNSLAHAYLFCGPRGVGKTTCARIFAKTINCENITPEGEACNECESCKAFNSGRSYNIHELDAASNNSVEDIRNLIDQVRIPPQVGKYSIYIVDEVHMLSAAAFNAFLKTLEEPPPHAKFILATTEKHKILPTILSRCQIFDFNRITVEDIVGHLANLAEKEGIEYDLDGLTIIAQKADGGMRDALSFFDQIASFSGKRITYENVIANLNVLDYDYYFRLTDLFLSNNYAETLLIFNEILDKGFDAHNFITGLAQHFRDLLVAKVPQTIELLEVGANIKEKYLKQSQMCSVAFLYQGLNIINKCDLSYKESKNKRLLVELTLMNLSNITQNSIFSLTTQSTEAANNSKTAENINNPQVKDTSVTAQQAKEPKKKTLSLKEMLNKTNKNLEETKKEIKTEHVENHTIIEDKKFTQEELTTEWKNYWESQKNVTARLASVMLNTDPLLKENNIFEIKVINQLLKTEIDNKKSDILLFLRKALSNKMIDFTVIIDTNVGANHRPYTDKEKYKYLRDKNSNLDRLYRQLNLDF